LLLARHSRAAGLGSSASRRLRVAACPIGLVVRAAGCAWGSCAALLDGAPLAPLSRPAARSGTDAIRAVHRLSRTARLCRREFSASHAFWPITRTVLTTPLVLIVGRFLAPRRLSASVRARSRVVYQPIFLVAVAERTRERDW